MGMNNSGIRAGLNFNKNSAVMDSSLVHIYIWIEKQRGISLFSVSCRAALWEVTFCMEILHVPR